jgi:hypothetical protein
MNGPSHAKSAKGAKDGIEKNRDSEILFLRPSWRSWRALRDERPVSREMSMERGRFSCEASMREGLCSQREGRILGGRIPVLEDPRSIPVHD